MGFKLITICKKYSKFVEAISMFFILVSWGLDWGGSKKWEQYTQTLHNSLSSIQSAYLASDILNTIKIEAAVTRFTNKKSPDTVIRFLGDYADSWKSPDVRYVWFQRFSNELSTINSRLIILKSFNEKQALHIDQDIQMVESNILDIQTELFSKLNINSLDGKIFLKPDFDLMTGREAGVIDGKLSPINKKLLELINKSVTDLTVRKSAYSNMYRFIFIVGSILLIIVKLIDWYCTSLKGT